MQKLFSWHRRCELPTFATHRVIVEATGGFALGVKNLSVRVTALDSQHSINH